MTKQMTKQRSIFSMIYNIVIAVIVMIFLVFAFPVALNMFGVAICNGCDILVIGFVFGFLPVAMVFIALYFIFEQFASGN